MDPSWTNQSLDMLGALIGVLLLILAAAWLLKRLRPLQAGSRSHLRVISVLPLSAKERVVLVQAGSEQVLVGVSGAGIQHLLTLNEPVATDVARSSGEEPGSQAHPFASQLRALMHRGRS